MSSDPAKPDDGKRSVRDFWSKNKAILAPLLVSLASALIGSVLTYFGVPPKVVETIKEIPVLVTDSDSNDAAPAPEDARYANGWFNDPDAVKAVAATLPQPVFANTPAGLAETVPDRVYHWDTAKAVLGRHIPARNQGSVGSCVAFGAACAIEYNQCVQIVAANRAGQPPPEFREVSQEVIYGGSRVQIGGGRIRGDGSIGAWGAQWSQQYGAIPRGKYDGYDLSAYSEPMCRKLGSVGCPKSLEAEAKKTPTKSISQVLTVADGKRALASGYLVTVASDVGFGQSGPYTRNAKGQLRPSGTWMHQMCFIGYDKDAGFYCMNSWGEKWVSGPTGPGNPPPGGFYVEEATVARMLAQGDSWAYGDQAGFPSRQLDWFVRTKEPPALLRPMFAATR